MAITILDGIVLGVALFSAVLAMVRGFSREVLSVASWVVAAGAAYYLHPYLLPYARQYTESSTIALVGAAGVIFLVALIIVSFITMRIADFIIDSRIGALDRTLGFVFGAARGVLLIVVAMLFFNWLVKPEQQPAWILQAKSKPVLDNLGAKLVALLPENIAEDVRQRLTGTARGENDAPAVEQPPQDDAPASEPRPNNG